MAETIKKTFYKTKFLYKQIAEFEKVKIIIIHIKCTKNVINNKILMIMIFTLLIIDFSYH